MKIVLIGPTYPFKGGISHYTTLLYQELKKKHLVRFFSFSRPYPKFLFPGNASFDKSKKPIKADKVEKVIDWACPLSWFLTALKIKQFKPNLVIFPWWMWGWATPFFTIAVLSKVLAKTKILFICHNVIEHESAWWKKILAKVTLFTGNFYITHSKQDVRNLKKFFPSKPIKKIFFPTYKPLSFQKVSKSCARKQLKVGKNIILFFGYIRPYKGLVYLLSALPEVAKVMPITLIIAGEFWENRKKYDNMISKLKIKKHVKIFDGYIPNEKIGLFFSAADLIILPYISATGSAVTQLAFGFNKPVVGTSVGDLPEVVESGRRGLIVPPKNPRKLADAIIKCYQENLIPVFEKNIKKDERLFSWDNLVKTIESFLK